MHVLIVNDDGIHSTGLRTLADTFHNAGHKVSVVAPESQRSAFSHYVTFMKPLFAQRVTWEGMDAWWIDGTPADCVKMGLTELVQDKVDIVVSGINNGTNLGTDTHYSGTVAAAMEAALMGMPAIAVSTPHGPTQEMIDLAAEEALAIAVRLLQKPLPKGSLLNINVPKCARSEVQGRVSKPLALIEYESLIEKKNHLHDWPYYWSVFHPAPDQVEGDDDQTWHHKGYITYSVLGWDYTMHGPTAEFLQE